MSLGEPLQDHFTDGDFRSVGDMGVNSGCRLTAQRDFKAARRQSDGTEKEYMAHLIGHGCTRFGGFYRDFECRFRDDALVLR